MNALTVRQSRFLSAAYKVFGYQPHVLIRKDRHKNIVKVRMAVYLVMHHAGFSFPEIGKTFMRDHSTIIHGVKKASILFASDPVYAVAVGEMQKRLS